jgi:uncharacterized protein
MPAYFFDSSATVKRFIKERGTVFVISLLRPSAGNVISVSQITKVEVIAALARQRKGKKLSAAQFDKAEHRFLRDYRNRLTKYQVDNFIIDDALNLAKSYELRGYDAIQLATVLYANRERIRRGLAPLIFVCADNELNEAAKLEGLSIENPNLYP